jgi:hypothetical protein
VRFQALLLQVKQSSRMVYYPECVAEIERIVDARHRDLAKANLMYFLPQEIAALKTLEERRAAIASIPDDCQPDFLKGYVKQQILKIFESR